MRLPEYVLKRFVKDYNLPINMFDDERFNYFIELYDPLYGTKAKLDLLTTTYDKLGGSEANFFKYATVLHDSVIDYIKSKPAYAEFISCDMNQYAPVVKFPEKNLYSCDNANQCFVSIDVIKANFIAMKFFNEDLVDRMGSYEEFISQFTDHLYFQQSKQIRQVIFGNLNPKRQQTIQKHMISVLANMMMEFEIPENVGLELFSMSSDEIILKVNDEEDSYDFVKNFDVIDNHCRVNMFRLEQMVPHKYFVKRMFPFQDGKIEFKCVPALFFSQVYKQFYSQDLHDFDFDFVHEGKLARFMMPLFTDSMIE
jgi:hypothetical protein